MINTPQPSDPRSPLTLPLAVPKHTSQVPVYAAFLFGVMFIGLAAIMVITIARPNVDNTSLYVMIVGFLTSTLTAGLAFIKGQEATSISQTNAGTLQDIHLSINSRFDKFADEIKKSSHAEGMLDERNTARTPSISELAATDSRMALAKMIEENTRLTQEIHAEQVRIGHTVATSVVPVVTALAPLVATAPMPVMPVAVAPIAAATVPVLNPAAPDTPVPVETRTEAEERKEEQSSAKQH